MSDLVEFLKARIAEDEAAAKVASVGSETWHVDDRAGETVLWWPPASSEHVEFIREHLGDDEADRDAQWSGQTIEYAGHLIAPHIARHDPARILAECEAKRRIVEMHNPCDDWANGDASTCPELCALALPYAGHPDYDETWRP